MMKYGVISCKMWIIRGFGSVGNAFWEDAFFRPAKNINVPWQISFWPICMTMYIFSTFHSPQNGGTPWLMEEWSEHACCECLLLAIGLASSSPTRNARRNASNQRSKSDRGGGGCENREGFVDCKNSWHRCHRGSVSVECSLDVDLFTFPADLTDLNCRSSEGTRSEFYCPVLWGPSTHAKTWVKVRGSFREGGRTATIVTDRPLIQDSTGARECCISLRQQSDVWPRSANVVSNPRKDVGTRKIVLNSCTCDPMSWVPICKGKSACLVLSDEPVHRIYPHNPSPPEFK